MRFVEHISAATSGLARPARYRRGSGAEPRVHSALQYSRSRLARAARPGHRLSDPRDPESSVLKGWSDRSRHVLSSPRIVWGCRISLNSLLASPSFAGWMEGEPLDIQRLLYTAEGQPRLSIISIAHLSDAERMFFVTILLNELLTWVRSQPGTPSLRALFYMDEVFGYFPAGGQSTLQDSDAHTVETGSRLSGWDWFWRRRTPSIWTTKAWRTVAHGCWAGCRRSETRNEFWKGSKGRPCKPALGLTGSTWTKSFLGLVAECS